MSILFSKLYTDVQVYSFEASQYIYQILLKNVEANSNNIKVFNHVLSDKTGEGYLVKPNIKKYRTYGSVEVEFSNDKDSVYSKKISLKKIDDIKFEKNISFMKIDVEGWDQSS